MSPRVCLVVAVSCVLLQCVFSQAINDACTDDAGCTAIGENAYCNMVYTQCTSGLCACKWGFEGTDCAIETSVPAEITYIAVDAACTSTDTCAIGTTCTGETDAMTCSCADNFAWSTDNGMCEDQRAANGEACVVDTTPCQDAFMCTADACACEGDLEWNTDLLICAHPDANVAVAAGEACTGMYALASDTWCAAPNMCAMCTGVTDKKCLTVVEWDDGGASSTGGSSEETTDGASSITIYSTLVFAAVAIIKML